MKRLMLAAAVLALPTVALADGMFWVVGSKASGKCEIVTSNPVIDGGNIWFGDGPYKSEDDAKLARSTISACPAEAPPAEAEGAEAKKPD
jgi:hypothetical protein